MERSSDDMIERYLQAVGFWLPKEQKQDILAELAEDLRSQIEDRGAELGRVLDERDVAAILKQRGRPILVAGSFLPQQRSLIGPALYPIYIFVLKIVALCYLVPWLLVWIGIAIFDHTQARFRLSGELHGLGTLWTIAFTQFGAITLIFAVIDRFSITSRSMQDWDPAKLPKVRLPQASKLRQKAIAGLVFGILGFAWLLAVPNFPFLLIGPAMFAVKAAPVWSTVYPFILILVAAGIFENAVTALRSHLTWFRLSFRVVTTLLSLWIVYRLSQTHVYLVPVDQHAQAYAAITNLTVVICVIGAAVGLSIGLVVHVWLALRQLLRFRRSSRFSAAKMA